MWARALYDKPAFKQTTTSHWRGFITSLISIKNVLIIYDPGPWIGVAQLVIQNYISLWILYSKHIIIMYPALFGNLNFLPIFYKFDTKIPFCKSSVMFVGRRNPI